MKISHHIRSWRYLPSFMRWENTGCLIIFNDCLSQRSLLWSALVPCFIHLNLLIHAVFCVISLSCNSLWSRDWYTFQGRAAACNVAKMGSFTLFLSCFSHSAPPRDSSKLCGTVLFLPVRWCCAVPLWTCAITRSIVVLGRRPSVFPACPCEPRRIWFIHCSIQCRKTEMIFNPSLQV